LALTLGRDISAPEQSTEIVGSGTGALLGLLSLYVATRDSDILDQSRAFAKSMAARIRLNDDIVPASLDHRLPIALYRLARLTKDDSVHRVARDAQALIIRRAAENTGQRENADYSACHGVPALAISLATSGPGRLAEARHLARKILTAAAAPVDDICCGRLGQIDAVLHVATTSRDRELGLGALNATASLLSARQSDGFVLRSSALLPHLGLMQGLSGIGYMLLRVAHPTKLPSILSWS